MSRPITASIPHQLGKEEARRRIAEGFNNGQKQFSVGMLSAISIDQRWEGDRLHLEASGLGQKITGRLDVRADTVELHVDLPDLLVAIAGKLAGTLKQTAQRLLEKK